MTLKCAHGNCELVNSWRFEFVDLCSHGFVGVSWICGPIRSWACHGFVVLSHRNRVDVWNGCIMWIVDWMYNVAVNFE